VLAACFKNDNFSDRWGRSFLIAFVFGVSSFGLAMIFVEQFSISLGEKQLFGVIDAFLSYFFTELVFIAVLFDLFHSIPLSRGYELLFLGSASFWSSFFSSRR